MFADQALRVFTTHDVRTVIDVGCGDAEHAAVMRRAGMSVTTVSLREPADVVQDYMTTNLGPVDGIWASHVLEHMPNVQAFLEKCFADLRDDGVFAITVPPAKHEIVGGHVSLWNAGLLLYRLILAGFDCSEAQVGTYGYNVSVVVRKKRAELPPLAMDAGDIEPLARFFPVPVRQGFDGRIDDVRWLGPRITKSVSVRDGKHIAILGLGPSINAYLELTKRMGGRHKLCDEVWAINALGNVFDCDMVFHMDDVRVQEIRAAARPDSNIAALLPWLKRSKVPVMTSRAHPDYPALVEFPLAEVLNENPTAYFNSTAAYAVAYAIHSKARMITIFGMDFTYPDAHSAEKGRACVEFWLGIAVTKGIKLSLPSITTLMDSIDGPTEQRFYGYDCVDVGVRRDDEGRIVVDFSEKADLPNAEEVEERYDHSAHPNALVA